MEIYNMPETFPNAWCNTCKKFQEFWQVEVQGPEIDGQLKLEDIACAVCWATLLTVYTQKVKLAPSKTETFIHALCDQCDRIQEVDRGELNDEHRPAKLLGGNIYCAVCGYIMLTVYRPT
jgi:hypothetical protein